MKTTRSDGALRRRDFLAAGAGALAAFPVSGAAQRSATTHVHDEILKLASEAPLSMKFQGSTAEDCRRWQGTFRSKLAELLGPFQPPGEWKTTVEDEVEFEDHSRRSLILEAEGHPALPVHLLLPKDGKSGRRPAVLALHGHGPFGYDPVVGIDNTPERKKNIVDYNYDYGRQLVRRGYVVVTPCFTPFGRRVAEKTAYGGDDACAVTFVRMQLFGKVLIAENLRDALWAFELLSRRPEVDAGRIGCVGLSYGGRMAMLTTAMEPRIRGSVLSGALNVMQERVEARYSCGAQVIPGLLRYGDVPEIAGLIAPRPALWEVGRRDGLMVKDQIAPAWTRMRKVYSALGAEDQLSMDSFDGTHRWNGVHAYPLLAKWLGSSEG